MSTSLFYTLRQLKPQIRQTSRILKTFSKKIGLAYLGVMDQHTDEYDAIRGFTASISHRDTHYSVGTYDDVNIRLVHRFDTQKKSGKTVAEGWVLFEFELTAQDLPHVFFIPTGKTDISYERVYAANIHMQPLNSALQPLKHSPSIHGRYQIVSRATHTRSVEALLTSPVIFGIGEKLWPRGIEIQKNKLYIYMSESSVSMGSLETACLAGLWLVKELNKEA